MQFLSVPTCFYCIHHDIFCSHKRQLTHQPFFNDLRINNKPVYYIQAKIQDAVYGQESLRNA